MTSRGSGSHGSRQELQLYVLGPPVSCADDLDAFLGFFLHNFLVSDPVACQTVVEPAVQYHVMFDPDEDGLGTQYGHGMFGLDIYAAKLQWNGAPPSLETFTVVGKDGAFFNDSGELRSGMPSFGTFLIAAPGPAGVEAGCVFEWRVLAQSTWIHRETVYADTISKDEAARMKAQSLLTLQSPAYAALVSIEALLPKLRETSRRKRVQENVTWGNGFLRLQNHVRVDRLLRMACKLSSSPGFRVHLA